MTKTPDGFDLVEETADAVLLDSPLRSLVDINEIERAPLEERLKIENFSKRIGLALEKRAADDAALLYVPDGDVDRAAERISFGELRLSLS